MVFLFLKKSADIFGDVGTLARLPINIELHENDIDPSLMLKLGLGNQP
jgi:hypothetical protein